MEINYAGRIEDRSLTKKERNDFIRDHFDIPTLRKCGFFKPRATFDEMEQRILIFFGYKDIREYAQLDEAAPNGLLCLADGSTRRTHYGRIIEQENTK